MRVNTRYISLPKVYLRICLWWNLCTLYLFQTIAVGISQFRRKKAKSKIWNRMIANVLKQDLNTKRFKRTLIYFNTDTQYTNCRGNPLYKKSSLFFLSFFKKQFTVFVARVCQEGKIKQRLNKLIWYDNEVLVGWSCLHDWQLEIRCRTSVGGDPEAV